MPDVRNSHLALNQFRKIGPAACRRLEVYFSDLSEVFRSSALELARAGLTAELATEFVSWRKSWRHEFARTELKEAEINFVTWNDNDYPIWLKEIADPPPLLYYRGQLGIDPQNSLAVVGARRHSAYAPKVLDQLLPPAIRAGIIIISGLARGVDSLAHNITLKHGGLTWAVMGSGLARIYPAENQVLADRILAGGGTLLSEFPPSTAPLRQNFPQRNRIISGLTRATLVIEAAKISGALITARYCLEQGRDVLTVPGNIFSESSIGPNQLIRSGAKPILEASDLLAVFNLEGSTKGGAPDRKRANY